MSEYDPENDIPKHRRKGYKPPTVANLKNQIAQVEMRLRQHERYKDSSFGLSLYQSIEMELIELRKELDRLEKAEKK